ncbi:ML domain-containing protein [Favolaschia claudopus]|uniref:Phosphatidylglycerol/phosphatidylinositol transfer protein n=1 Tax=Favolaschia claudopus TaxID=2862362 RepID=A0AAW0D481_9AGAR
MSLGPSSTLLVSCHHNDDERCSTAPSPLLLLAAFTSLVVATPSLPQLALTEGSRLVADSWGYDDCGDPSDSVQLKSITVDLEVVDTVTEGAIADVTVKAGRIKLLHKIFDICEEARNANASVSCPVEPGEYSIVQTVELPKEVPKLKYVINVRGYTSDDDDAEPMACVDLTVQWRPFFPGVGVE